MMTVRVLSFLLFATLTIWVIFSLSGYSHWRVQPEVLGPGNAFEGSTQLPKEEINRRWNMARQQMIAINQRGRWFSVSGDVCSWLTFACTAAITLIAGYYGRLPPEGGARATDTAGLPAQTTRLIAFVAALGAVLTAGGSLATNRGHDDYDRADKAQALINQTIKTVQDAKTEREARDALDELDLKIIRL
jgi:hypothetical protein